MNITEEKVVSSLQLIFRRLKKAKKTQVFIVKYSPNNGFAMILRRGQPIDEYEGLKVNDYTYQMALHPRDIIEECKEVYDRQHKKPWSMSEDFLFNKMINQ